MGRTWESHECTVPLKLREHPGKRWDGKICVHGVDGREGTIERFRVIRDDFAVDFELLAECHQHVVF